MPFYRPRLRDEVECDTVYELVQLRGPANADVSAEMEAWAKRVEAALNAPERETARWVALEVRGRLEEAQWQARQALRLADVWLDAKSERQLRRVLAWLGQQPPPPEVLLSAPIAGYQYHAGPQLQDRLGARASRSISCASRTIPMSARPCASTGKVTSSATCHGLRT